MNSVLMEIRRLVTVTVFPLFLIVSPSLPADYLSPSLSLSLSSSLLSLILFLLYLFSFFLNISDRPF